MKRQKNRKGLGYQKNKGHGEAERQKRRWRGRKTESYGVAEKQRKTWRGKKTEKDMER